MATAVVKTETKKIQTEVSEEVVKLEVSREEAEFLYSLMQVVAGHPVESYRGIADDLAGALATVGVNGSCKKYITRGTIYCRERGK